jgi:hypothetical protein
MAAIYSNGGNRWNILGFNFTKRDALSSVYKISMLAARYFEPWRLIIPPTENVDRGGLELDRQTARQTWVTRWLPEAPLENLWLDQVELRPSQFS